MKKSIHTKKRNGVAAVLVLGLAVGSAACSTTYKGQYLSQKETQEMGGVANYVTKGDIDRHNKEVAEAQAHQDALAASASAEEQQKQADAEAALKASEASAQKAQDALAALRNELYFETDSATLRSEAQAPLSDLGNYLAANPDKKIRIEGFTDNTGKTSYNDQLSNRRAESVAQSLKSFGVKDDQIAVIGGGEKQPIAANNTDEGRAMNRRVELKMESGTVTG